MRIITQEIIDFICPNHSRTSCSDENISNGYGGWTGKFNRDTGSKEVVYPRCNRCYLMSHIGENLDELDFEIDFITLRFREK